MYRTRPPLAARTAIPLGFGLLFIAADAAKAVHGHVPAGGLLLLFLLGATALGARTTLPGAVVVGVLGWLFATSFVAPPYGDLHRPSVAALQWLAAYAVVPALGALWAALRSGRHPSG